MGRTTEVSLWHSLIILLLFCGRKSKEIFWVLFLSFLFIYSFTTYVFFNLHELFHTVCIHKQLNSSHVFEIHHFHVNSYCYINFHCCMLFEGVAMPDFYLFSYPGEIKLSSRGWELRWPKSAYCLLQKTLLQRHCNLINSFTIIFRKFLKFNLSRQIICAFGKTILVKGQMFVHLNTWWAFMSNDIKKNIQLTQKKAEKERKRIQEQDKEKATSKMVD